MYYSHTTKHNNNERERHNIMHMKKTGKGEGREMTLVINPKVLV
jgi:hypothetical protein